jgi:hypothetical protein
LLHKPFWTDFGRILWEFLTVSYMDETWIHLYDLKTKEQSKEWRYKGSIHPKKLKTQMSSRSVLASVFLDKDGILLVDYLEKGATKMAKYCVALLYKTETEIGLQTSSKLQKKSRFFKKILLLIRQSLQTRNWQIFNPEF